MKRTKPEAGRPIPKAKAKRKGTRARPTPKAPNRRLTPKQEAFYRTYLDTGNASESYRRCYSVNRMSATAVSLEAHRLLNHPIISHRLREQQEKVRKTAETRYLVTKERVIAELAKIAFARSTDFFKWNDGGVRLMDSDELTADQIAAVGEVSERPGQYGKTIRVKLHDKVGALEKLGRHVGAFKAEAEEAVDTALGRVLEELAGGTASLI